MRKLTKNTIKPVLKYLDTWDGIHRLNTADCKVYHFTLDYYNDKPSFQGGFSHSLDGCFNYNHRPYDAYAIDIDKMVVYDLLNNNIAMVL